MREVEGKRIYEKEINLLELLIEILLRWRVIVVWMIIGGILFGAISYVASYAEVRMQRVEIQQQEQESEKTIEEEIDKKGIEEKLTDIQINNVKNVLTYEKIYESKSLYQENSLLMNVNPFELPRADLTLWIESDNIEKTYNIQKIYEDVVCSSGLYDYIKKNCETKYDPSEMISLEATSNGQQCGNDIVRVSIYCLDEDQCQKVADCIIMYVGEKNEQLKKSLGEHEVTVLDYSVSTVVNTEYFNLQERCEAELMNYRSSIANLKAQFSEDEKQYYNCFVEQEEKVALNTEVENNSELDIILLEPSINIRYIIIGMIATTFIYIFYVFMRYILDNKLRSSDDLMEMYALRRLGIIPALKEKKRLFGFIDAWFLSLKRQNKRKFVSTEIIDMAAVAVKMAVKQSSHAEVFLVGCDIQNQTIEQCKQIQTTLSKVGIKSRILDNVLYNVESMTELENAHCVVLVEKVGATSHDEIVEELELLKRQNIMVLGSIVVE